MKKAIFQFVFGLLGIVVCYLTWSGLYILEEGQQAIITQFGRPVGKPITEPGVHFKIPFLHTLVLFEKRILTWNGDPNQITTKGQKFIIVDTTARWKIVDPLKFLESVQNESGARVRLNNILDSATRNMISSLSFAPSLPSHV